jgi:anti-sigma factor RsiW
VDCIQAKRIFPRLMSGELPQVVASEIEEHLLACEDCSREFEAYESRFFNQYEPAGKAVAAAAKAPLPEMALEKFYAGLKARLSGECAKIESGFAAFSGGEMDKKAAEGVATHLQACDPCSKAFETYESRIFGQYEAAGKALAAARAVEPPNAPMTGFYQKVMARIARDRSRSTFRRAAVGLNAAAVLMIAVSVGVLVGRPVEKSPVELPGSREAAQPEKPKPLGVKVAPDLGLALPASTGGERRFSVDNVRPETMYGDPTRRAGGLEVVRPDGNHGLDESHPLRDGDSVGF